MSRPAFAVILAALLALAPSPLVAGEDGGSLAVSPDLAAVPDAGVPGSDASVPGPFDLTDPRQAVLQGAKSAVAADCARCVGGAVPFFRTRNGGYAILGIALGGAAQLVLNFVLPYVLPPPPALDQAKP